MTRKVGPYDRYQRYLKMYQSNQMSFFLCFLLNFVAGALFLQSCGEDISSHINQADSSPYPNCQAQITITEPDSQQSYSFTIDPHQGSSQLKRALPPSANSPLAKIDYKVRCRANEPRLKTYNGPSDALDMDIFYGQHSGVSCQSDNLGQGVFYECSDGSKALVDYHSQTVVINAETKRVERALAKRSEVMSRLLEDSRLVLSGLQNSMTLLASEDRFSDFALKLAQSEPWDFTTPPPQSVLAKDLGGDEPLLEEAFKHKLARMDRFATIGNTAILSKSLLNTLHYLLVEATESFDQALTLQSPEALRDMAEKIQDLLEEKYRLNPGYPNYRQRIAAIDAILQDFTNQGVLKDIRAMDGIGDFPPLQMGLDQLDGEHFHPILETRQYINQALSNLSTDQNYLVVIKHLYLADANLAKGYIDAGYRMVDRAQAYTETLQGNSHFPASLSELAKDTLNLELSGNSFKEQQVATIANSLAQEPQFLESPRRIKLAQMILRDALSIEDPPTLFYYLEQAESLGDPFWQDESTQLQGGYSQAQSEHLNSLFTKESIDRLSAGFSVKLLYYTRSIERQISKAEIDRFYEKDSTLSDFPETHLAYSLHRAATQHLGGNGQSADFAEVGLEFIKAGKIAYEQDDHDEGHMATLVGLGLTEIALGLNPVSSFSLSAVGFITGTNAITQEKLSTAERALALFDVLTLGGAGVIKSAVKSAKLGRKVLTILGKQNKVLRYGDEAAEAGEKLVKVTNSARKSGLGKLGSINDFAKASTSLLSKGKLPPNYITKADAKALGWKPGKGNLVDVAPGKMIGGDVFKNVEGKLPPGTVYREADLGYRGGKRGNERFIYGENGRQWVTSDHYQTFTEVTP